MITVPAWYVCVTMFFLFQAIYEVKVILYIRKLQLLSYRPINNQIIRHVSFTDDIFRIFLWRSLFCLTHEYSVMTRLTQANLITCKDTESVVCPWRHYNVNLTVVLRHVADDVYPCVWCKGRVVLDNEVKDWSIVFSTWLPAHPGFPLRVITFYFYICRRIRLG